MRRLLVFVVVLLIAGAVALAWVALSPQDSVNTHEVPLKDVPSLPIQK